MIRLLNEPDLPRTANPDELSDLVSEKAVADLDLEMLETEVRVRQAYGLRKVLIEDLAPRAWGERARDLTRDGWSRLRGLTREEEPIRDAPRQIPAPLKSNDWPPPSAQAHSQEPPESATHQKAQEEAQRWNEAFKEIQRVEPIESRKPHSDPGLRRTR